MIRRSVASTTGSLVALVALGFAVLATGQMAAQTTAATAGAKGAIPRTPWGAPDLNGVWTGNTMTPLERPDRYANKPVLTEEEVAAAEKQQRDNAFRQSPPRQGDPGTYNQIWADPAFKGVPDRRTSLIVDPPDGKLPVTPAARTVRARASARYGKGPYNSFLDLDTGERCLTDGLPIYYSGYNNNYQIFQTEKWVAILHEYYHETRIIPLDGRNHDDVPQWGGDGRGHWEGDTLVVETTRFADKGHYEWADPWRAPRATTYLTERFTRNSTSIEYEFTWEEPSMFTRPWTARWPLSKQAAVGVTEGPLYEYACHEGNLALPHVLGGARAQEDEEATGKSAR